MNYQILAINIGIMLVSSIACYLIGYAQGKVERKEKKRAIPKSDLRYQLADNWTNYKPTAKGKPQ